MEHNTIQRILVDFLTAIRKDQAPCTTPSIDYQPHALPQIDPHKTMHLCFQNVRGAHPHTEMDKFMEKCQNLQQRRP